MCTEAKTSGILFVPSALNEVLTIAMVRPELEAGLRENVKAIALGERLERLLKEKGFPYRRLCNYQTKNASNIVEMERPDLLLTNDYGDITRAFTFAAIHLGIPVLSVDDGVTLTPPTRIGNRWYSPRRLAPGRVKRWLKDRQRFQRCHDLMFVLRTLRATGNLPSALVKLRGELDGRFPRHPIGGLKFAVAGQAAKKAYVERGYEPSNIFVTGQPRFDTILRRHFSREKLTSQLGLRGDKSIVVLATQPLANWLWTTTEHQGFVRIIVEAMTAFPRHQLVIKPHPAEDPAYYEKIIAEIQEGKALVCRDVDIYELLAACDLLVTAHSTVALEAMILDKPVITVNLSGQPDLMPYASSGAAVGVHREEELIPAVRAALYDPQVRKNLADRRKSFVLEHSYRTDGQASTRVAALIEQLVKEHKKNA